MSSTRRFSSPLIRTVQSDSNFRRNGENTSSGAIWHTMSFCLFAFGRSDRSALGLRSDAKEGKGPVWSSSGKELTTTFDYFLFPKSTLQRSLALVRSSLNTQLQTSPSALHYKLASSLSKNDYNNGQEDELTLSADTKAFESL
jgi:hypothetical protein